MNRPVPTTRATWSPGADRLDDPLRWKKPRLVEVNFDPWEAAPSKASGRNARALFGVMAAAPLSTFIVTTAYPDRAADFFAKGIAPDDEKVQELAATAIMAGALDNSGTLNRLFHDGGAWPLPNVYLLTRASTQADLDTYAPTLLRCPAAVRGLDIVPREKLELGTWICLHRWTIAPGGSRCLDCATFMNGAGSLVANAREPRITWLRISGDGGPRAAPLDLDHVRGIVEQAKAASVPVWLERLGGIVRDGGFMLRLRSRDGSNPAEWPTDLREHRGMP